MPAAPVYPAKDARMSAATFSAGFERLENFAHFAASDFSSSFWRRVSARCVGHPAHHLSRYGRRHFRRANWADRRLSLAARVIECIDDCRQGHA
jgi:hypothetical protein